MTFGAVLHNEFLWDFLFSVLGHENTRAQVSMAGIIDGLECLDNLRKLWVWQRKCGLFTGKNFYVSLKVWTKKHSLLIENFRKLYAIIRFCEELNTAISTELWTCGIPCHSLFVGLLVLKFLRGVLGISWWEVCDLFHLLSYSC